METKVLADNVLIELANYNDVIDAKKKIEIKKNVEDLISQLQSKLLNINQSDDVKELVKKDRTEKIKQARDKTKSAKTESMMQIVK